MRSRSGLACFSVMTYQTSGASETIFVNFLSRSSRATGPNTRVPIGSSASLIKTAALSSNRMYVPSLRRCSLRMRTMTHFTTLPCLIWLSGITANGQDARELASAGVVRHRQPGSHLNHWSAPLSLLLGRRTRRQHFLQAPPLQLRERPRRHNANRVARLGLALFVMGVKLLGDAHHAAVLRMLHQPDDLDDNGFFHFRAGDLAGEHGALSARVRRGGLCFGCHYAFLNSCARSSVLTRAKSFLDSRSRFSASACPVVN